MRFLIRHTAPRTKCRNYKYYMTDWYKDRYTKELKEWYIESLKHLKNNYEYTFTKSKPFFTYSKFLWLPKKIKVGHSYDYLNENKYLYDIRWLSREIITCEVDFLVRYPNAPSKTTIFIRWVNRVILRKGLYYNNFDEFDRLVDETQLVTTDKFFARDITNLEMIEQFKKDNY